MSFDVEAARKLNREEQFAAIDEAVANCPPELDQGAFRHALTWQLNHGADDIRWYAQELPGMLKPGSTFTARGMTTGREIVFDSAKCYIVQEYFRFAHMNAEPNG